MSADNQQGRSVDEISHYISGFVDGEGSFHVAIQQNPTVRLGWQVIPEFHVSQRRESKFVLELIRETLGCGYLKPNHAKNPRDSTWVFVVRSHQEIKEKIIPFFIRYPLLTAKRADFEKFAQIVELIAKGNHRDRLGFEEILRLCFSMNASGFYRKLKFDDIISRLKPSETLRQTSNEAPKSVGR